MLKGLHGLSPTLLGERLRRLEHADIIERRPNPAGRGSTYYLTTSGAELAAVVKALGVWGQRWLEITHEHLDPDFLMWAVYTHLPADRMPPRRQVVRFDIGHPKRSYWLVLQRTDPDLCYSDPGFGDDLVVSGSLEALARIYLGELELRAARAAGLVQLEGSREAATSIAGWFPRSSFAAHARQVRFDRGGQRFVPVA